MKYKIRNDQPYQISLCENDRTRSIIQNLSLLFATKKGTVPMYRDFGLSQIWVDKPIAAAQALLLSDVTAAVEKYEARAKVISVQIENEGISGRQVIVVEVEI